MIKKEIRTSNNDYPYDGAVKWNTDFIKDTIKKAKTKSILPDFGLERVEIQPTSLCQYNCPFCYGINLKDKKRIDLPLENIKKNIFQSIREDKKLSKYDPIIILAGLYSEPLLYPEKIKLIEMLGKYNFRFGIYTNGNIMDNEVMRAICVSAKLAKSKRTSYVSFNISGAFLQGHYDSLARKIREFTKIRNETKSPVKINIPILIDGKNLSRKDLIKIQDEMINIGVDNIRYSIPQIPVSSNNFINTEYTKLIKELRKRGSDKIYIRSKLDKQFNRCFIMANTLSIDCEGNVYPCSQTCSSLFNKLSYGSVSKKELSEIWNSREHQNLFYNFDETVVYCRCNPVDDQFNTICSVFD